MGIKGPTSSAPRVLLIDDDQAIHGVLRMMLLGQGWEMVSAKGMEEARVLAAGATGSSMAGRAGAGVSGGAISVVLLDKELGDVNGFDVMPELTRLFPQVPVVLVTASGTTEVVVEAMRRGAFDFVCKPVDEARLVATVVKGMEHYKLMRRLAGLDDVEDGFEGMIGSSPAMRGVFGVLRHVGPTDATVMITGESGTGKELVARGVHQISMRSKGPFVAINMAALPRELVEATLFGHEKGAFTGAEKKREGAVGQAQGGTLFLDEIGEMPLELQAKLLRFLQERVFRPVGASDDVIADVRIVSATNRDPMAEVEAGKLRADLYYRLSVVPVQLPPLRHRPGDIELIAGFAIRQFAAKYGKKFDRVESAATACLIAHSWPGNVRELMHMIERVVVLNDGTELRQEMLPPEISGLVKDIPTSTSAIQSTSQAAAHAIGINPDDIVPISDLERRAVENALRVCNGSAAEAAKKLGMSTATIYRKIKEWGISSGDGGKLAG